MKRVGIILAIAALVLLFASAIEAKENATEEKSSPTAKASRKQYLPPELGFIK